MNTMILGFSEKSADRAEKQASNEVQELKLELAKARGKLGYQVKVNNKLQEELNECSNSRRAGK